MGGSCACRNCCGRGCETPPHCLPEKQTVVLVLMRLACSPAQSLSAFLFAFVVVVVVVVVFFFATGVADDALEEHHPLRIKEFKRNARDKAPMQLEATGLLAVGDMVVAINGKSVRGR